MILKILYNNIQLNRFLKRQYNILTEQAKNKTIQDKLLSLLQDSSTRISKI
jgi:hypothetical protein